jgi:hypothetical protein
MTAKPYCCSPATDNITRNEETHSWMLGETPVSFCPFCGQDLRKSTKVLLQYKKVPEPALELTSDRLQSTMEGLMAFMVRTPKDAEIVCANWAGCDPCDPADLLFWAKGMRKELLAPHDRKIILEGMGRFAPPINSSGGFVSYAFESHERTGHAGLGILNLFEELAAEIADGLLTWGDETKFFEVVKARAASLNLSEQSLKEYFNRRGKMLFLMAKMEHYCKIKGIE